MCCQHRSCRSNLPRCGFFWTTTQSPRYSACGVRHPTKRRATCVGRVRARCGYRGPLTAWRKGRRGREWALVIAARIVHHEEMRSTLLWPVSIGLAALACDGSSVTSNSPPDGGFGGDGGSGGLDSSAGDSDGAGGSNTDAGGIGDAGGPNGSDAGGNGDGGIGGIDPSGFDSSDGASSSGGGGEGGSTDPCAGVACSSNTLCMVVTSGNGNLSVNCITNSCSGRSTNPCSCIGTACQTLGGACSDLPSGTLCTVPAP